MPNNNIYKPRVRGKDKVKDRFKKFGKNTSKGERIKSEKIKNSFQKKKSNINI